MGTGRADCWQSLPCNCWELAPCMGLAKSDSLGRWTWGQGTGDSWRWPMLHGEVGYCAPEAICVSSAGVSIMVLSTEIYILPVLTRNPVQRPIPFSLPPLFSCHLDENLFSVYPSALVASLYITSHGYLTCRSPCRASPYQGRCRDCGNGLK